MRNLILAGVLAVGGLLAPTLVNAEEMKLDPLLELLVKQGVITVEQAAAVQAAHNAEQAEAVEQPAPEPPATPRLELPSALDGLKIGTLTYVSYQDGSQASSGGGTSDYSRFTVKRGYIDIKKKITTGFGFRVTPDVHQDDSGDFKVRLKYLYATFDWKQWGFLGKPNFEVGIAHMPWLDFEEHINRFRLQDTMFMERNGLFNSADVGVTFAANLGPDLPEDYTKAVNDHYAGRWGSFSVGVYNGGGYHASEANSNKVIEGRLTVRPLPDVVPGLQLSLLGLSGSGNTAAEPDWDVLNLMVSYESPYFVATGQMYDGAGNQKGSAVDSAGRALDQDGYSLFTEVRCPKNTNYSLFARYDSFDTSSDNPDADVRERSIIGLAWQFHKGSYWVLDYDRLEHSLPGVATEDRVQLTLQIKY